MEKAKVISELEKQTKDILTKQLKSVENLHPQLKHCQLKIKKENSKYKTVIQGRYGIDNLKVEGKDKKLLRSFLKASRYFNSAINSTKVKNKMKDSMADYPLCI